MRVSACGRGKHRLRIGRRAMMDQQQVFDKFWRKAAENAFVPRRGFELLADVRFLTELQLTTHQMSPSEVEIALNYLAADYGLTVPKKEG